MIVLMPFNGDQATKSCLLLTDGMMHGMDGWEKLEILVSKKTIIEAYGIIKLWLKAEWHLLD